MNRGLSHHQRGGNENKEQVDLYYAMYSEALMNREKREVLFLKENVPALIWTQPHFLISSSPPNDRREGETLEKIK
jgi:hypothetical protein